MKCVRLLGKAGLIVHSAFRATLPALCLLIALCSGVCFGQTAANGTDDPMQVGKALSAELKAGESKSYSISMAAGEFVQVGVEPRKIDVTLRFFEPKGKKLLEVAIPAELFSTGEFLWIAQTAGVYRVDVSASEPKAEPGTFEITLKAQRPATEEDKVSKLLKDARAENKSGNHKKAEEIYAQALKIANSWKPETVQLLTPWNAAATYYTDQGDFQRAANLWLQLIAILEKQGKPTDEYYDLVLDLYIAKKDFPQATMACEHVISDTTFLESELLKACATAYHGVNNEQKARALEETNRIGSGAIDKWSKELAVQRDEKNKEKLPELVTQTGHTTPVMALAFTPDGREVVSVATDGNVKHWQVSTGRELKTTALGDIILNAALTPDGETVVYSTLGGGVAVRGSGMSHPREGADVPVTATAISDSGDQVAAAGTDHKIRVWKGFSLTRTITVHSDKVRRLAFLGENLLVSISPTNIVLTDLSNSEQPTPEAANGLDRFQFSRLGRWVALTYRTDLVRIRQLSGDNPFIDLKGNGTSVASLAFSPDERLVAVGSQDGTVKLWECETGKELGSYKAGTGGVAALAFSPDQSMLAASSWSSVILIDLSDGRTLAHLGSGTIHGSTAVLFDPQTQQLFTGDYLKNEIAQWDLAAGRLTRVSYLPVPFWDIKLSPDGRLLATLDDVEQKGSVLRVHEINTWKELAALELGPGRALVGFVGNDKILLVGPDFAELREWSSGKKVASFPGKTWRNVAISADYSVLATATAKEVVVFSLQDEREIRRIPTTDDLKVLALSPDGKVLVGSNQAGTIHLWDISSGEERGTLHHFSNSSEDPIYALQFRDRVTLLSLSTNGWEWTWNTVTQTPTALIMFSGKPSKWPPVFTDRFLIQPGADGFARIYDNETGKLLTSLLSVENSQDWVAASPEGMFDGSGSAMEHLVAWHVGGQTFAMDRFFDALYTPDLVRRLLSGERPHPVLDLAKFKLPPEVRITSPAVGTVRKREDATVVVSSEEMGGGISEVRLFENGKLVGKRSSKEDGALATVAFQVTLIPGRNVLRAVALSNDTVESNADTVQVTLDAPEVRKPALHVVVVGINQYRSSDMNLQFARPDGEALENFFKKSGPALFREVKMHALFDQQASRAAILSTLEAVAKESQPEDVVLLFFSGHGEGVGQQYFFIPADFEPTGDDDEGLPRKAISALILGEAIRKIPALKLVLVLDSCQSGAALNVVAKLVAFRGAETAERKATQMLARSAGVYLIAASTKDQSAIEATGLKHGILTYVLLQGLGETGAPEAAPNGEGLVTMFSLLQYVNQQVPELTEKYAKAKQYPMSFNTGMDFPVVFSQTAPTPATKH